MSDKKSIKKSKSSLPAPFKGGKKKIGRKKRARQKPVRKQLMSMQLSQHKSTTLHNLLFRLRGEVDGKTLPKVKGLVRCSDDSFSVPDGVDIAQSMVSLNTVYEFRLGGHSTLSASTGVINTFIPCDPSSSGFNFTEWPTLSALFSEFRLKRFRVQFVNNISSAFGSAGGYNTGSLAICGNLGTAVAPGSYAAVADNADSHLWAGSNDFSAMGYTHTINGSGIEWSQVTTPTTEPFAGAPGSIQVYGTYGNYNLTDAVQVLVVGIYEFRSRV